MEEFLQNVQLKKQTLGFGVLGSNDKVLSF